MKKVIPVLLGLCGLMTTNNALAQSFTLSKELAKETVVDKIDVHIYVRNTTGSPVNYLWNVYKHDFPADWTDMGRTGICDNVLCWGVAVLGDGTSPGPVKAADPVSDSLDMKLTLVGFDDATVTSGTHSIYVQMADTGGKLVDSFQYEITKNPSGTTVRKVRATEGSIAMYPNPAQNDINVVFDANAGIRNIAVYNLIGKAVNVYRVQGNSAKLDISNIPSGIYFLRFTDANGRVVASRKFTHQ